MSLVIEALRRVEKTDARAGSVAAAVASYRPAPRPRGSVIPLLLGLLTGGTVVFLLGAQGRNAVDSGAGADDAAVTARTRPLKGAAGLPPPLIIETAARPEDVRAPKATESRPAALAASRPLEQGLGGPAPAARPSLVLQAISERDSRPIAIINDQLVREGEKLGAVRVLRIGADSVEVQLENGQHDTVRFAPPPPPAAPEASPSSTPDPRL